MKILVYGLCLLVTSLFYTLITQDFALQFEDPFANGTFMGIYTIVVYYLGCFFIPRQIVRALAARRGNTPADAPAADSLSPSNPDVAFSPSEAPVSSPSVSIIESASTCPPTVPAPNANPTFTVPQAPSLPPTAASTSLSRPKNRLFRPILLFTTIGLLIVSVCFNLHLRGELKVQVASAKDAGYQEGYDARAEEVDASYDRGYGMGWSEGYDSGYDTGFFDGWDIGVDDTITYLQTGESPDFSTYPPGR